MGSTIVVAANIGTHVVGRYEVPANSKTPFALLNEKVPAGMVFLLTDLLLNDVGNSGSVGDFIVLTKDGGELRLSRAFKGHYDLHLTSGIPFASGEQPKMTVSVNDGSGVSVTWTGTLARLQ